MAKSKPRKASVASDGSTRDRNESKPPSDLCLIVALGASAGGLEPLEEFFRHTAPDTGVAFVVVQHLAPDHETALPQLLARRTAMRVEQAQDNSKIQPNCVYTIPPGATLTVKDGFLQVSPAAEPRGKRTPIDSLFRTLAEDRGENAVCIILSGTGSDGTLGLRAIKEHGGMALAQTLDSAKYDTILRSAIATGFVDHVLPVAEMPAKIVEYAAHLGALVDKPDDTRQQILAQTAKIHSLLLRRAGHDFSLYKENTIVRRIDRRMKALQIDNVNGYVQELERDPEEVDRLFKDLLIGVTHFFRDPGAFEALSQKVIPKLFEGKTPQDEVRACVVGCASGEEAYSIAILLLEHASTLNDPPRLKVFATDIDERGLEMARKGLYPLSVEQYVEAGRLERFFTRHEQGFQVNRDLRDICIFSTHSFIKDPPFSRQDLISCRNVMIYLGLDLQRRIVPLFHYALNSRGFLFLGPAEAVAGFWELFQPTEKKHQIFQKKDGARPAKVGFPLATAAQRRPVSERRPEPDQPNFPKHLERILMDRYAPACVVVKENGDAVFFSGRVGRYLELPAGSPNTNAIDMARDDLRIPLRTSLHKAAITGQKAGQKNISIRANGGFSRLNLTAEPFGAVPKQSDLYLIVFEEMAAESGEVPFTGSDTASEDMVRYMESEVRAARDHAQAAFEELETTNEELRSANEEFQSTNEELETSKEEIQSANEELETMNTELNRKVDELDHLNSDLQNLLDSTRIATIFLDSDLRIRAFTPAAGSVFRLIAGDVGRPITDLAAQFQGVDLSDDIREVLRTLAPRERMAVGTGGRFFQKRILPYRTAQNRIQGVVLTFTDVTNLKEAEQLSQNARAYAENIVQTVREPLLVLDAELRIKSANAAFYRTFGLTAEESVKQSLFDFGNSQWNTPELRSMLNGLSPDSPVEAFELEYDVPILGRRTMLLNARVIQEPSGDGPLILLAIEDITERKRSEVSLRSMNVDLKHFAFAASHDLQEPLRMVTSYTQLLAKTYRGQLDSQADQFIAYAVEGAQRMEKLLRDLRDYWSVNEQEPRAPVAVDCNVILDVTLEVLATTLRETGGAVSREPLPTIMADEVPMALLFQNLIGNAVKYHRPETPPRVHISATRNGKTWTFSFRDNGIGIQAGFLEQVFLPFKRLHRGEYPGSGLGLALCQRIVERYGGRIWAESEYGRGSTFRFTLPAQGPYE